MCSLFLAARIYYAPNKSKVISHRAMDEHDNDGSPFTHNTDTGQIGAILQARINLNEAVVGCRIGSLCTVDKNPVEKAPPSRKRRRADEAADENLMTVNTLKSQQKKDHRFAGVSLTDIPYSDTESSFAKRYPDACGRVAVQVSGIANVVLGETNDFLKSDDIYIGSYVSLDFNSEIEFGDEEKTVGLKKTDPGDQQDHFVGMVCDISMSPTRGKYMSILLLPQMYGKQLKSRSNLKSIDEINLNRWWGKLYTIVSSVPASSKLHNITTAINAAKAANKVTEGNAAELTQLVREIEQTNENERTPLPQAKEVSSYGKYVMLFGIGDDTNYPGIADALIKGTVIEEITKQIRANIDPGYYEGATASVLTKSEAEAKWVLAWEKWAKNTTAVTYDSNTEPKVDALNSL